MNMISGQDLINGLRAFNSWRDDFFIELSTLFLMIGFVAGTVDVLTSDGLSQIPWFNMAWAIVQAIAIDGLFFAVWGKIRRATWTRATWFSSSVLVGVGLLLAIVASLVNGLLSYQELNQIADVRIAMASLGIDQATFTYARAILVVLVSILVSLFCREATEEKAIDQTSIVAPPVQVTQVPVIPVALPVPQATAIPEQAISHSPDDIAIDHSLDPVAHSPQAPNKKHSSRIAKATIHSHDEPQATEATDEEAMDRIIIISSPVRDRIKEAMIALPDAGYQAIANHAECGYSTVKKYASDIRKELSA